MVYGNIILLSKQTIKLTPPCVEGGICAAQSRRTTKSTTILAVCKKSIITILTSLFKAVFFLAFFDYASYK